MKRHFFLLLYLVLCVLYPTIAQNRCDLLVNDVRTLIGDKQFEKAFEKAEAAQACASTEIIERLYRDIFDGLKQQTYEAEQAKERVQKASAELQLLIKKVEAESQLALVEEQKAKVARENAELGKASADSIASVLRNAAWHDFANNLLYKSQGALEEGDRTTAFRLAEFAYRYVEVDNPEMPRTMVDILYNGKRTDTSDYLLPWRFDLTGHAGSSITSVAFSPDGGLMATGASDLQIKKWKIPDGVETGPSTRCVAIPVALAFSPEGKYLAVAYGNNSFEIQDRSSGLSVWSRHDFTSPVVSMSFVEMGKQLIAIFRDGTIRYFLASNGQVISERQRNLLPALHAALSGDGLYAALVVNAHTVKVYDVFTAKIIVELDWQSADGITALAFSSDVRFLAIADQAGTIKIQQLNTRLDILEMNAHAGVIHALAFSPDDAFIATGSTLGIATLWHFRDADNPRFIDVHENREDVDALAFSSNGALMATSASDSIVTITDWKKELVLWKLKGHKEKVKHLTFAPNGRWIASAADDNTLILWDLNTGKKIAKRKFGDKWVDFLLFSPDSRSLAVVLNDGNREKLLIWNFKTNKEFILNNLFIESRIAAIAFSPEGQELRISSLNGTVMIMPLDRTKPTISFETVNDRVSAMYFNASSHLLAVEAGDRSIQIWDIEQQKIVTSLPPQGSYSGEMAFSSDHKLLAIHVGWGSIRIWDVHSGIEVENIYNKDEVQGLAFVPNSNLCAWGDPDGLVKFWKFNSWTEKLALPAHDDLVTAVAFSPNSNYLASGTVDNAVIVWNVRTGEEILAFGKMHDSINHYVNKDTVGVADLCFSPNGNELAVAYKNRVIKIWDWQAKKAIRTLNGFEKNIDQIVYSPNGRQLAVRPPNDGNIQIINLEQPSLNTILESKYNWSSDLAFSPDGLKLAVSHNDREIAIWDFKTKTIATTLQVEERAYCLAFSPDGTKLVAGGRSGQGADAMLNAWDTQKGKELYRIEDIPDDIYNLSFPANGQFVLIRVHKGPIQARDANNGKLVFTLDERDCAYATIAPDGQTIAGIVGNRVLLWPLTPSGWLVYAAKKNLRLATLTTAQLAENNLEDLLLLKPESEAQLVQSGNIPQISAFADLYAEKVIQSFNPPIEFYTRARRLYEACRDIGKTEEPFTQKIAELERIWLAKKQ